jgi:adenine-specific DNA-methyltransferase
MSQFALDFGSNITLPVIVTANSDGAFRPIHYLGSKLRVVEEISLAIDDIDPGMGPVLDLFAGSGTVAVALSNKRTVFANDIQEYSRVICSALLSAGLPDPDITENFAARLREDVDFRGQLLEAAAPLVTHERTAIDAALAGDAESICELLEYGSLLAVELGDITSQPVRLRHPLKAAFLRLSQMSLAGSADITALRYFGGAYFSYAQATELDCLSHVIETYDGERRELLRAALLSTASDVVNTVGKQFAQPIRPRSKEGVPKQHLIAKIVRDRSVCVTAIYLRWVSRYAALTSSGRKHHAIRADYMEVMRRFGGQFSVVYADPPYTRDHYSRFYHVLETLALRDNPIIALSPGAAFGQLSRGLYRDDRHQSPFCIKSRVEGAFKELFSGVASHGAGLVLSYSPFDKDSQARPRLMSIDAITTLAQGMFRHVEVRTIEGVSHSKLNHSRLNYERPSNAEVLFLCRGPKPY